MNESATRIGSDVAGYRLEALIGRGGMSVVYLAEHMRLGRKVAIKLLAPALSEDAGFRARFERESQRAAEIDHPNIIPIYDAGEADGELYIAMRYVRGPDLKSLLARDGALSVSRALFFLEQAASALDAAHDRGLVHRDVKPANILVEEPAERVYVTDFGVVKHTLSRGATKTGFFVGTTDYAAPEQIEGQPVDARTDVYAFGCVLYECLTQNPPFDRDSELAVMHAHLSQPPPLLSDSRADLPKTLDRVIARAMAKDKDERYASCTECIQAARAAVLDQPVLAPRDDQSAGANVTVAAAAPAAAAGVTAYASEPGTTPPPGQDTSPPATEPPPPPTPPPPGPGGSGPSRSRSWIGIAAAAVAAAVAAGLIVFFLTRSDDSNKTASPSTTAAATTNAATTQGTATETTATTAATTAGTDTGPDAVFAAIVPNEVFKHCAVANTPREGATATALCAPSDEDGTNFFPDQLEISTYPDAASRDAAFNKIREEQGIETNTGACNGVSWGGEGPWLHPTNPGDPKKPGGKKLCYFDGDKAVLVWTHEKLGQATHHDMLGIAREGGTDHAGLFGWWRFWTHRIGLTTS